MPTIEEMRAALKTEQMREALKEAQAREQSASLVKEEAARAKMPTQAGAALTGAAHGATFGLAQKAAAGLGALYDVSQVSLGGRGYVDFGEALKGLPQAYKQKFKEIVAKDDAEIKAFPKTYLTANLAGSAATLALPGAAGLTGAKATGAAREAAAIAKTAKTAEETAAATQWASVLAKEAAKARLKGGAALGAISGLGMSKAETLPELASDVVTGAGTGLVTQYGIDKVSPYISKGYNAAKGGVKKVLSVLGGVSVKNIDKYLENPQAIKSASQLEEIKNLVDDQIKTLELDVSQGKLSKAAAEFQVENLRTKMARAYEATRATIKDAVIEAKDAKQSALASTIFRLKEKTAPQEVVGKLLDGLEQEKQYLGSLSEQADDALARSGATFKKTDILDFLKNVGSKIGVKGVAVADEEVSALQKLNSQYERLQNLPEIIDAPTLRDVLKSVRRDINYNQAYGEFNDTLNQARKSFGQGISEVLKGRGAGMTKNPALEEYAAYMKHMAERAELLGELSSKFGTQQKATSAVTQAIKGTNTVSEDLLKRWKNVAGNTFIDDLAEYKEAYKTITDPTKLKALENALPETRAFNNAKKALDKVSSEKIEKAIGARVATSQEQALLQKETENLADALQAQQSAKGWTVNNSFGRLKSAMSDKNPEIRKSLEVLSAKSGIDFGKMLENRNVADAFEKGYMNGSRNVNLWSILGWIAGGSALKGGGEGHALLGALGTGLGATIDRFGPKMSQKLLDGYMALRGSKFAPILLDAYSRGLPTLAAVHEKLSRDNEYRKILGETTAADRRINKLQRGN